MKYNCTDPSTDPSTASPSAPITTTQATEELGYKKFVLTVKCPKDAPSTNDGTIFKIENITTEDAAFRTYTTTIYLPDGMDDNNITAEYQGISWSEKLGQLTETNSIAIGHDDAESNTDLTNQLEELGRGDETVISDLTT